MKSKIALEVFKVKKNGFLRYHKTKKTNPSFSETEKICIPKFKHIITITFKNKSFHLQLLKSWQVSTGFFFFLYNLQSICLLSVYSPFISLQCVVFFFVNLVLGGEYSKNRYTCL